MFRIGTRIVHKDSPNVFSESWEVISVTDDGELMLGGPGNFETCKRITYSQQWDHAPLVAPGVPNHMATRNILTDARQLDWAAAKAAAQRIIKRCDDAGFTAPEALEVIRSQISYVADDLNVIAKALLISPPGKGTK